MLNEQLQNVDSKNEIWKPVPGYEGFYEVSSIGRVRSVDHYVNSGNGRKLRKGRVLSQSISIHGYYFVHLSKINKQKSPTVHRLVALAFHPNPENKICVNHKDGVRTNNHISNLEWCTHKENTRHLFDVLGGYTHTEEAKYIISEKLKESKKKYSKPVTCIEDNLTFPSLSSAALYYDITPAAVLARIRAKKNRKETKTFVYASINNSIINE